VELENSKMPTFKPKDVKDSSAGDEHEEMKDEDEHEEMEDEDEH
jgi:hypothetical protein